MIITKLILEKFKKIKTAELHLSKINLIVGTNNAGKSSILQGIHFSILAAAVSRSLQKDTFTQDSLQYLPSKNFGKLRNGDEYLNQSNFSYLQLWGEFDEDYTSLKFDGPASSSKPYTIRIYRGRNEGNVGCSAFGSSDIPNAIYNPRKVFSIYVPGLAGIAHSEQYKTPSVILKAIASGDSNLYLRNILHQINGRHLMHELEKLLSEIFQNPSIKIKFNPNSDIEINAEASTNNDRHIPLELCGTGLLQAIHIFSYVVLYKPQLLLLDEPDSHLHPDNQVIFSKILQTISEETNTQSIISTHSKYLVENLTGKANLIWLQDGEVKKQGHYIDRLPLMMDLGALGAYDKLIAGNIKYIFLTEDTNHDLLKILVKANNFNLDTVMIHSYKTSTNIESTHAIAKFIKEISSESIIIVHRDRDFMTPNEVDKIKANISNCGAIPFITNGSDIESYFCTSSHIAESTGMQIDECNALLLEIINEFHIKIMADFVNKRNEIKIKMYKKNPEDCPDITTITGGSSAGNLRIEHAKGKFMLRKLREKLSKRIDIKELLKATESLEEKNLQELHK